jgi:hypothetical protein
VWRGAPQKLRLATSGERRRRRGWYVVEDVVSITTCVLLSLMRALMRALVRALMRALIVSRDCAGTQCAVLCLIVFAELAARSARLSSRTTTLVVVVTCGTVFDAIVVVAVLKLVARAHALPSAA